MMKIYTVFDSKSESHLPPVYFKTRGEALRGFLDAASNDQSTLSRYPGDFTIFEVGEFDELTCRFDLFDAKLSLGTILELKGSQTI